MLPGVSASKRADNKATYEVLSGKGFVMGENDAHSILPTVSGEYINISSIDKPSISHNSLDRVLTLSFIGNDVASTPYLFNWYFNTANFKRLTVSRLDLFKPNKDIFTHNLSNYHANSSTNEPGVSALVEAPLARWSQTMETRMISHDSFTNSILDLTNDEIPQSYGSSVSGRSINPSHTNDMVNLTTRLGTGGSANSDSVATDGSELSAAPYSHNTSYLLLNTALSGVGHDVTICFDVAIYTNTSTNSAYAQTNIKGYNG